MPTNAELRYLIDSYLDWTRAQHIPVIDGIAVDLNTVETAPWPRFGADCRAAFVHLRGRGDFIALQVIDIAPGGKTDPMRHLYDEMFYALSGNGSVTVELDGGQTRPFSFGPRALFSLPMNAPFRISNASGSTPLRIVSANDLPFVMNIFRNENFLFDNAFAFPERAGKETWYHGQGDFLPRTPGTHMLETNSIPDLATLELPAWEARGAGSRHLGLVMADSTLHAHVSEMPATTYKKAYRHSPGAHVLAISGSGYTLMWKDDDAEFERHEWKPGVVFALPAATYHQHFNTGDEPARYLVVSMGSHRYPALDRKVRRKSAPDTSIDAGGPQVDYQDQDPRIHQIWLQELAKAGRVSGMGQYFDEQTIAGAMQ